VEVVDAGRDCNRVQTLNLGAVLGLRTTALQLETNVFTPWSISVLLINHLTRRMLEDFIQRRGDNARASYSHTHLWHTAQLHDVCQYLTTDMRASQLHEINAMTMYAMCLSDISTFEFCHVMGIGTRKVEFALIRLCNPNA
jgi:hypothetical protein